MRISVETREPAQASVDMLVLPLFQAEDKDARLPRIGAQLDRSLGGKIASLITSGDFKGKKAEKLVLYPDSGIKAERLLLLGLGKESDADLCGLRQATAEAVKAASGTPVKKLGFCIPVLKRTKAEALGQALAEGAILAGYRFDRYKPRDKSEDKTELKSISLFGAKAKDTRAIRTGVATGIAIAESQNLSRALSNEPGGQLTPAALAKEAQKMAREVGLSCKVLDVTAMKKRKMGGILAVGQGSCHPPRMIILEHGAPKGSRGAKGSAKKTGQKSKRPTLCIVGKGVTFDSGGISLKPGAAMDEMKHDMSGAAAVVGILRATALLNLPLHVVGIIGAAENLPSSTAYRPGDIITTMSGKKIEILNTDAEGRVVLSDALHLAHTDFEPQAIIDLATLTGAAIIALGHWCSGVIGNDDGLISKLVESGEQTGERLWQLPLWDGHKEAVKSPVADVKNTAGREAGTITAGAFLSAFVKKDIPWAHLDIAATAWTKKSTALQARGATGVGVQLLVDYLRGI